MSAQSRKHHTGCPVANGTDTFGDRWTLLVIRDMMIHGKKTYGEFLASGENISTNILADRLKHLEASGIVNRSKDPANGKSYLYTLTEKGLSLAPVIFEIIRWSGQHLALNASRKRLLERIEKDPQGLLAEIRARHAEPVNPVDRKARP